MFIGLKKLEMLLFLFALAFLTDSGHAWDSDELKLFDLVEEVNLNFYDFLGITINATNSELRRSYRKLSLQMHPDKNLNDPEADKKFRRLVAVYEILKDEKLRERYNEVLKFGLPDWRMPVFYYRKLRKMTIKESMLLISLLVTIFHYCIMWGSYFEKKLNMEDGLNTRLRRQKALDRKKGSDKAEAEIAQELSTIPKPTLRDILPFALARGSYNLVLALPQFSQEVFGLAKDAVEERQRAKQELKDAEEDLKREREEKEKRKLEKKERKKKMIEEQRAKQRSVKFEAPVVYQQLNVDDLPQVEIKEAKSAEWTDEEVCLLVKAVAKFPGGLPGRWEKISEMMDRPVSQVTAKVKLLKDAGNLTAFINTCVQNRTAENNLVEERLLGTVEQLADYSSAFEVVENTVCNDSSEEDGDEDYSRVRRRKKGGGKKQVQNIVEEEEKDDDQDADNEEDEEVNGTSANFDEIYESKSKKKAKKRAATTKVTTTTITEQGDGGGEGGSQFQWSQTEQKALEAAMRAFPKGTPDRWDRIVEQLPSKTKAECMSRIKSLSTIVRQRQDAS